MKTLIPLLTAAILAASAPAEEFTSGNIYRHIQTSAALEQDKKDRAALEAIYSTNEGRPVWMLGDSKKKIAPMLAALEDPMFNYKRRDFGQAEAERLLTALNRHEIPVEDLPATYGRIDFLLSSCLAKLSRFIKEGDVDWGDVSKAIEEISEKKGINAVWEMRKEKPFDASGMAQAALGGGIREYLESLIPMEERYKKLVAMLRELEEESEEMTEGTPEARELEWKMMRTLTNLEKARLYGKGFSGERIEVNIPEFKLRYFRKGGDVMEKKVVVGKRERPTPVFSDEMEYMVINPTWTVPSTLARKDVVPALIADPSLIESKGMKAYVDGHEVALNKEMLLDYRERGYTLPYKLVQSPGENNALGRVKFIFPNRHFVFLHDTNHKSLFSKPSRAYSSGCVRLEKPFELARSLEGRGWKKEVGGYVDEALKSEKKKVVYFKNALPIHMLYFTAFTDGGKKTFKKDIYLYDAIIEASTRGEKPKLARFKKPETEEKMEARKSGPVLNRMF